MMLPPLSLYIHVPWCVRKCPYCDFNSHQQPTTIPEDEYIDALIADLREEAALAPKRRIHSIFIGGGTPSLLSAAAYQRLFDAIDSIVGIESGAEITLEANPGTVEQDKFIGYRAAGINRLSIGVQSFAPEQLTALGRIHSSGDAVGAATKARAAGFENFNIDLMHGLPEQSPAQACDDIQQAIDCGPSHISWYQLTIEKNTEFYNRPPVIPNEDILAEIQGQGEVLLNSHGYFSYEVSAFAQQGKQSQHNLNYWQFGDYLGIGAGAHGKISNADGSIVRRAKTRLPRDYLAADKQFCCQQDAIQAEDIAIEFLMNSLRLTDGVAQTLFQQRSGQDFAKIAPQIKSLQQRGLLRSGDRIATTALGRRYLDSILEQFI